MNCKQINNLKEAYADGLLASGIRAAVEAHLAGCPSCQARLTRTVLVRNGLGAASKEVFGDPSLVPARALVLENQLLTQLARPWTPGWRYVPLAAALLVLLVVMTTSFGLAQLGL